VTAAQSVRVVRAIRRILREHRVPRVSQKRYRPGPKRRPELHVPGQSVQVDVKHLKAQSGVSINSPRSMKPRATASSSYDHDSIQSAIHFIDEGAPGVSRRDSADSNGPWLRMGHRFHLASS
jgi:hypothetical protein